MLVDYETAGRSDESKLTMSSLSPPWVARPHEEDVLDGPERVYEPHIAFERAQNARMLVLFTGKRAQEADW
jgi:hypothetical protein